MSWNRSRSRRQRSGQTLILVVLLIFGIMALAALVIDLGYARLAQRQMQSAVDSAALEGLRGRDVPPEDIDGADPDEYRREQARKFVQLVFDDDLDTTDDPRNFGAGPVVEFSGGVGDPSLNAGQFIYSADNPNPDPNIGSLPLSPVYKPQLELNLSDSGVNRRHGDMVAGTFDPDHPNPNFIPPGGDTNPAINEYSDTDTGDYYVRRNFVPADSTSSSTANAFLVRMRRLHDNLDIVDTELGVSSKGPEIPLLFGRGALLPAIDSTTGYSPRHHGVTVRGTAIATTRNVTIAGPAFPSGLFGTEFDGMSGLAPFAVASTSWPPAGLPFVIQTNGESSTGDVRLVNITTLQSPIPMESTNLSVSSSEGFPAAPFKARIGLEIVNVTATNATVWTVTRGADNTVAGFHNADEPIVLHQSMRIGTVVSEAQGGQRIDQLNALDSLAHQYIPLFSPTTGRVIGFGFAESWSWDNTRNELTVQFTGEHIAPANASASLSHARDAVDVIPDNLGLTNSLLAPVLVR